MTDPARRWLLGLRVTEHPPPACAAPALAAAEERLGPGPVGWAVATARSLTEDVIEEVPEHGGGPGPFETLRRSVEATVLLVLYGLLVDHRPGVGLVAPEAVEGNGELVRRGIPLDRVLRGVRIGHARLHRELMAAIGALDEETRQSETHRVTELLFAYADTQASLLAEEYIAERERWRGSSEAARRSVVEDLLAGRSVDAASAAGVLGYDLDRHHLAFIVWAGSPDIAAGRLHRYAAAFSRELGADHLLTVPAGPSVLWAWTSWTIRPVQDLAAGRAPDGGVHAATGPVAWGRDGFRRSHLGAREAERIARTTHAPGLTRYPDIRVAALATADSEHCRWFVREVLGELAEPDGAWQAELRETLRVYLAEGRSPQQAAERLHINRNTVTYRVKRAEELLGRPVGAGLELWLALEALRALPEG